MIKKKFIGKICFVFCFLLLCFTVYAQSWQVEYYTKDSFDQKNWIEASFRITNNSGNTVPMTELTIRYWYTIEGTTSESFSCWWAQVGFRNVDGTFVDMSPAATGANRYCEIGFTSDAGSLANGSNSGGIQCGWHKSDWSNYDETDDYSRDHTVHSFTVWDKVGLYHNGDLVWGVEPDGTPTPEATPEDTPEPTPEDTPEPTPEATSDPTPEVTPEVTPDPVGGQALLLEAEDYTNYYDTTSGNEGNTYRTDDVDIEPCAEGGYNVGWITQDEWLEFEITITENDIFDIYVRLASPGENAQGFYITIDGDDVTGWIPRPNTGAWQSWQDAVANDISITAGTHTLRIVMNGDFNLNFLYVVSATDPPGPTEPPGALPTSTPPPDYQSIVSQYGQLQVIGTDLCDENGDPVRLKGMCSHGLQWFPFMAEHTIHNLVYDWEIQVIRPAMYIEDYKNGDYWGGYIAQPEYMKSKLVEMIEDALDVGIYVLIDWHIHNDPTNFTTEAIEFYTEMATTYGGYPNIIYEICNEPENVSWATVKTYADDVIPVIRAIDPDNIIIVGTQNWCQDLDVAADSPLTEYTNLMYALHFYAGSHGQSIRDKADYALDSGLPVFVSEWGTSDCTGGSDGVNYFPESDVWVQWMVQRNLSWINWNLSNKSESSAALVSSANIGGPWAESDISDSGFYIKDLLAGNEPTPQPTPVPGEPCSPSTPITIDFVYDGVGEYCWETDTLGNYINSWNLDLLMVNGIDFTNIWVGSSGLPAKIDGMYYVYYKSSYAWGHFEAKN